MTIRNLFAPFRKRSRALDEEVQFHLEKQVEANIAAGMPPNEARRQALIAFGGVQQTKERIAEVRWTRMLEVLLLDARYAWRLLRKSPLFTTIVVITLAVGIGLNTAVFSLIDAVLFRALPAQNPEGLVVVRWHALKRPKTYMWRSYGECSATGKFDTCSLSLPWSKTVRSQTQLFSGVAAFAPSLTVDLSGNGPATITNRAEYVSGDFFPTLGIKAALGRTL
ncbi:MAG TPA: permease prefix domain 1-containing protein, partial [Candidatus Angelobacter sp.]|nr:permease prefix domain 1-containing protein [Candidatus Angelobacter sp.]